MGTRADFYVGIGPEAEWLGSIAFDGYRIDEMDEMGARASRDSMACWAIKTATTEADYRRAVSELLDLNDDGTKPEQGWPWPWDDSNTTDYTYAFIAKCPLCEQCIVGGRTFTDPGEDWPDMSARRNTAFGQRSGMIIVGG